MSIVFVLRRDPFQGFLVSTRAEDLWCRVIVPFKVLQASIRGVYGSTGLLIGLVNWLFTSPRSPTQYPLIRFWTLQTSRGALCYDASFLIEGYWVLREAFYKDFYKGFMVLRTASNMEDIAILEYIIAQLYIICTCTFEE